MGSSLVVGCGFSSQRNLCKGQEIVAVDVDKEKIVHARQGDPQAHFLVSDGRFLPFRSDLFNDVVCIEVLEHIENYEGALLSIVMLRPREIYLTFPTELKEKILMKMSKVYRERHWKTVHVAIVQLDQVVSILHKHGYGVEVDVRPGSMTLIRAMMSVVFDFFKFDYEIPETGLVSFEQEKLLYKVIVFLSTGFGLVLGRMFYVPWKLFKIRTLHDSYIIHAHADLQKQRWKKGK